MRNKNITIPTDATDGNREIIYLESFTQFYIGMVKTSPSIRIVKIIINRFNIGLKLEHVSLQ